ncbi:MAG: peptidoglycan DD-metalloendopeptidase family protein, partial [Gammaproteobacteria bacterium]|nr:peptidoglycan DD-metalloendopeptidase family protein [Gammaproteobacteria bacterium]
GPVITRFGATNKTRSGMHIGGKLGQPVKAAAAGKVVYAGDSLPGYGQLLIIKHNSQYLSAYGHNQQLLVGEGDQVSLGQSIAKMGEGPGNRPLLHFEIRRSGRPVDPLIYLPRR